MLYLNAYVHFTLQLSAPYSLPMDFTWNTTAQIEDYFMI